MPWIKFKHYGIVDSDGQVYHFNNSPNCQFSKTSWDLFAQNYQVYVLDIDGDRTNTILGRATMLQRIAPEYYLHKGNCEHAALFCKTRKWKSKQVRRLLIFDNIIAKNKFYKVNYPNKSKAKLNLTLDLSNSNLKSYKFSYKTFQALPQYVQQNDELKRYLTKTLDETAKGERIEDFLKEVVEFSTMGHSVLVDRLF
ncbi:hypothetical protein FM036_11070 [Nostoc sp. HG1]|nr:hypothetical protein [Nostoc sp. HG1]